MSPPRRVGSIRDPNILFDQDLHFGGIDQGYGAALVAKLHRVAVQLAQLIIADWNCDAICCAQGCECHQVMRSVKNNAAVDQYCLEVFLTSLLGMKSHTFVRCPA